MTPEEFIAGYLAGRRRIKATAPEDMPDVSDETGAVVDFNNDEELRDVRENDMILFVADEQLDPTDDRLRECGVEQLEWES